MDIPTPKYRIGSVIKYIDKQHTGVTKYTVSESCIIGIIAEYLDSGIYRAYERSHKTGRESEIKEGVVVCFRYLTAFNIGFEPGSIFGEGILESEVIGLSESKILRADVIDKYYSNECDSKSTREFTLQGYGYNYRERQSYLYSVRNKLKELNCKWNGKEWTIVTYPDSESFNKLESLRIELIG